MKEVFLMFLLQLTYFGAQAFIVAVASVFVLGAWARFKQLTK